MTQFLFLAALVAATPSFAQLPVGAALAQAHAHNDYLHARPLADALAHGFRSVEADIWLTNGALLVAHDFKDASPGRTLEKLYLEPLRALAKTNAAILRSQPVTLLIDVKSEAESTYARLREVLKSYSDILTRFESNRIHTNAVIAIISGSRAQATMREETIRFAAIDGRLPDLASNPPPALVPLVSDNWTKHFTWRGVGPLPLEQRNQLREVVERTHAQNRRLRLWAAPDTESGWRELAEAGVDLINTDKLSELERFLRARQSRDR